MPDSNENRTEKPTLNQGDLLAYLEGTASAEVRQQIEQSPALLADAAALGLVDTLLQLAQDEADQPTPDDLLAYQAGLLDQPERARIDAWLERAPHLQAELAELEPPADFALTGQLESPVQPVSIAPSWLERLQQHGQTILRALQLPAAPPTALALRGDEPDRQLYQVEGYQIVLALTPPLAGEQIWQLEGQLSPTGGADLLPAGTVHFSAADQPQPLAQDRVDEFGYFSLEAILESGPDKLYTLAISLPETLILIEEIALS